MNKIFVILFAGISVFFAFQEDKHEYKQGSIHVEIETGEDWIHDFPLFLGIKLKNPPQFAIWIEDTMGNYLTTIYVTEKIATQGWVANKGNRRMESLPHWCHKRNVEYNDELFLPTKTSQMPDVVTGPTPKGNQKYSFNLLKYQYPIVIKAEFNHSTDFNDCFPKDAVKGSSQYTGGKEGSGQPALVYSATIYPDDTYKELILVGHSSPDGTNGSIYPDLNEITTAKSIVKRVKVYKGGE